MRGFGVCMLSQAETQRVDLHHKTIAAIYHQLIGAFGLNHFG